MYGDTAWQRRWDFGDNGPFNFTTETGARIVHHVGRPSTRRVASIGSSRCFLAAAADGAAAAAARRNRAPTPFVRYCRVSSDGRCENGGRLVFFVDNTGDTQVAERRFDTMKTTKTMKLAASLQFCLQ